MSVGLETSELAIRSPRVLWIERPEWLARWGLIGTVLVVDTVWLASRHIDEELLSFDRMKIAIVLLPIAAALAVLSHFFSSRTRSLRAASDVCESLAQVAACSSIAVPLASLMAGLNLPLVDDQLLWADRALGFDWPTASAWVTGQPHCRWYVSLGL